MSNIEKIRRRYPEDSKTNDESSLLPKKSKYNAVIQKNNYQRKIKYFIILLVILFSFFSICLVIFLAKSTPTYPQKYSLPEAPILVNPLNINDFNTSKLLHGEVFGPEFLCLRNGLIYTGTLDGKVLEIDEVSKKFRVIAKLGKGEECGFYKSEETCGRPLGMEFDTDGFLMVVDAYLGIFRVDVVTGLVQNVVSPLATKTYPHHFKMIFLDDLEITANGDIYFTHPTNFPLKDFILDVWIGATNGKLLKYDPISNLVTIAASNLAFPNGILLSRLQDYILIAETTRARITKYNIKGKNAGMTETWVENLPCSPDNLYYSSRGTIWVGCSYPRHRDVRFSLLDMLKDAVWIRRLLQELPVVYRLLSILKSPSLLLEISQESGKILRTIVDSDGKILQHTSHVSESADGSKLYVGSYKTDFIGVIEL